MALRPLLLAAVVGIAAAGAFPAPAAQARGYVSISVGTPAPHYRGDYGYGHHRAGYVWVPGHWYSTHQGRMWVPGQYVRARGYGYDRGYDRGVGYPRAIHRPGPVLGPLPGGFYYQRGGHDFPRGHYPPRDDGRDRGW